MFPVKTEKACVQWCDVLKAAYDEARSTKLLHRSRGSAVYLIRLQKQKQDVHPQETERWKHWAAAVTERTIRAYILMNFHLKELFFIAWLSEKLDSVASILDNWYHTWTRLLHFLNEISAITAIMLGYSRDVSQTRGRTLGRLFPSSTVLLTLQG